MTDENLHDTARHDQPADAVPEVEAPVSEAPPGAPASEEASSATPGRSPQYGVGPFSIREVALAGVWFVAFVVSFFPINLVVGDAAVLIGGPNVWVSGLSWILAIGLPTVAVFLLVLRRLSPQGIRGVGSLGVDQFASVAFSVSFVVWLTWLWETLAVVMQTGLWIRSWVIWVEAVVLLAGVVLTVFAPLIPVFAEDFRGRPGAPAHRNARPVRPVSPRPVRERPARPAAPAPDSGVAPAPDPGRPTAPGYAGASPETRVYDVDADDASPRPSDAPYAPYAPSADPARSDAHDPDVHDPDAHDTAAFDRLPSDAPGDGASDASPRAGASASGTSGPETQQWAPAAEPAEPAPSAHQAFWALAPVERDVVDDYGRPLFRIGPTAWALVIEDRGEAFVVRHEDGRIGYLHDVSGVTRG